MAERIEDYEGDQSGDGHHHDPECDVFRPEVELFDSFLVDRQPWDVVGGLVSRVAGFIRSFVHVIRFGLFRGVLQFISAVLVLLVSEEVIDHAEAYRVGINFSLKFVLTVAHYDG